MPGIRDRNLRSGDLQEELGLLLLKMIALVAPIPRQEDVGNDAFVTLVRPEGSRRLIPDLSLLVQLKSRSVTSVTYKAPDELEWISNLEYPLFIGRTDLKQVSIELFTTQRLHQILLESDYSEIELLLDQADETSKSPNIRRANLGPPVISWSMTDVSNPGFLSNAYEVIRPHVDALKKNCLLRGIQTQRLLKWGTGRPPTDYAETTLVSPKNDIADTLREMVPHMGRVLMEMQYRKRYADFHVILAFFDLMKRWGVDPDPNGTKRLVAGSMAEGPEISIEEVINIRHAFQTNGALDLRWLPISDKSLAAIPNTVTQLALVNTSVTDFGIPYLLKITGLKRLNIAGTQITNSGLLALKALHDLEWVCVNRTQVTTEGVNQLKVVRPEVTVLLGSEP